MKEWRVSDLPSMTTSKEQLQQKLNDLEASGWHVDNAQLNPTRDAWWIVSYRETT